ncbi:hypothetical protein FOYG_09737 [Fusarium oxysporum NRRL 32931]|uniref:Uncharacterized protein n=1 Tax=Fusarium oxysporum NRRL 32931 TaxID=660029 RepID=W9I5Q3_FUSOX|nr:hypothetical protein FOYG_09737 [Fusarium oxysporum NRRL 32931]
MTQSFVTNGVRPGPRYLPICHAHAACSLARAGSVSNHDVHLLASHRPGLVRLGVNKVPCQTLPFSAATWPENNFKALSSLCQSDQSSAQTGYQLHLTFHRPQQTRHGRGNSARHG